MKRKFFWFLAGIILLFLVSIGLFFGVPGKVEQKDGLKQHSRVYIKSETVAGDYLVYKVVNMTSERLSYDPGKFTIEKKIEENWITLSLSEEIKEGELGHPRNDLSWGYAAYSSNKVSRWMPQILKEAGEYRFSIPCCFEDGIEFYAVGYFTVTAPAV